MAEIIGTKNRHKLRLHYLLAFLLLLHCVFFIVYWVAVGRFRGDVDRFVADLTGLNLPYTTIVIILTAFIGLWSLIRLIRIQFALRKGRWTSSARNWIFFFVWLVFTAGFYGAFYVILNQNPAQKGVLVHLLNLVRIVSDAVLFLFAAIWLRRLVLNFREKVQVTKGRKWPWTVGIALSLVLIVGLWLVPALFPPNWAYQGSLPTRPALLAHRGASMLAPENTLASAELAAAHQALGFETDVRISLDGVPFLMHDDTLARTTNISEVFPDRVSDPVSNFTIGELKQLNAGLWFIQSDPYETIKDGLVSQSQLAIDQGQHIPTLSEALEVVKNNDMVIMFDMRPPAESHPFYEDFFEIVLETCREARMNGDVWFLVDSPQVQIVVDEAPQMTRVVGASSVNLPTPDEVLEMQYEIVNVDTGILAKEIRAYRNEGLGVNVYTIDEPWLFSQFWLSGVTSVTTTNIHSFNQLNKPFINVPYARFLLFWGFYGIIIAIWLASSQPELEPEEPRQMETPDLMDFARDGDETVDTTRYFPVKDSEAEDVDQVKEGQEETEVEDHDDGVMDEQDEGD